MINIGINELHIMQNTLKFKSDFLFKMKLKQENQLRLFEIMHDEIGTFNNIRSIYNHNTGNTTKSNLINELFVKVTLKSYEKKCQDSILKISKYLIGEEGVKKEVYVKKEGRKGFIDFMNTKHNYYLELKRPGINITYKKNDKLTKNGKQAIKQTKQYKGSKIKNEEFINQIDFSKIKGVLVMGDIDNHSNKKVLLSDLSKNNGDILIVSWDWLIMYFRMMLNV